MGGYFSSLKKKVPSEKMAEEPSKPVAFRHYASAQTKFEIPLIANGNAYLGDIWSRYVRLALQSLSSSFTVKP